MERPDDVRDLDPDVDLAKVKHTTMDRRRVLKMGVTGLGLLLTGYGIVSAQNTTQNPQYLPIVIKPADPTATTTPSTGATVTATTGATATPSTGATVTPTVAPSDSTTAAIVAAANAFLATLSDTQKASVLFDFSNTAQKQRWSNLPQGLYTRAGLMWGNLSTTQQNACLAVLQAILSTEGYNRVIAEWTADDQLAAQGGGSYGRKYYWVSIIGTPSTTSAWQWQWGGHHVTVNATIVGSNLSLTPSFIGVQPASYTSNGTTIRPLGDIEDEAFTLINSLDSTQKSTAVLGSSPIDLVLGPGQDGKTIASEGLPASQMTTSQKAAFLTLISHYTNLANADDGAVRTAEITANLDQTYLAWYGPTTAGSAVYFRVTGPTIVIEYSPQSMGGSAANHIHGIYRDPTNDYGEKYTGIAIGS